MSSDKKLINYSFRDAEFYYGELFSEAEWERIIHNLKLSAGTEEYEKELTGIYKDLQKAYYRLYLLTELGSFEYYHTSNILNQLWHEYIHQKSLSKSFCQMDFENKIDKHPFII